jgi:hypothetical protein
VKRNSYNEFVRWLESSHIPVLIFSTLPVWAADKGSDEETLRNATTVLQGMLASKVPAEVLAKADCDGRTWQP